MGPQALPCYLESFVIVCSHCGGLSVRCSTVCTNIPDFAASGSMLHYEYVCMKLYICTYAGHFICHCVYMYAHTVTFFCWHKLGINVLYVRTYVYIGIYTHVCPLAVHFMYIKSVCVMFVKSTDTQFTLDIFLNLLYTLK